MGWRWGRREGEGLISVLMVQVMARVVHMSRGGVGFGVNGRGNSGAVTLEGEDEGAGEGWVLCRLAMERGVRNGLGDHQGTCMAGEWRAGLYSWWAEETSGLNEEGIHGDFDERNTRHIVRMSQVTRKSYRHSHGNRHFVLKS
jgi:hypothetical protein